MPPPNAQNHEHSSGRNYTTCRKTGGSVGRSTRISRNGHSSCPHSQLPPWPARYAHAAVLLPAPRVRGHAQRVTPSTWLGPAISTCSSHRIDDRHGPGIQPPPSRREVDYLPPASAADSSAEWRRWSRPWRSAMSRSSSISDAAEENCWVGLAAPLRPLPS